MKLLPMRDLIQDSLGNYYVIAGKEGKKLLIVNAVVYYSFNHSLSEVDSIYKDFKYDNPVALGQPATDVLKGQLKRLPQDKYPGNIYKLNEVIKEYEVEVDPLYEREVYTEA